MPQELEMVVCDRELFGSAQRIEQALRVDRHCPLEVVLIIGSDLCCALANCC
jgi:hypothetical protein